MKKFILAVAFLLALPVVSMAQCPNGRCAAPNAVGRHYARQRAVVVHAPYVGHRQVVRHYQSPYRSRYVVRSWRGRSCAGGVCR